MHELLNFIERRGDPWCVRLEVCWDENTQAFSVTIHYGNNLGHKKQMTRKVWPASGVENAITIMTNSIRAEIEPAPPPPGPEY